MPPASSLIVRLGGASAVARGLGIDRTTVWRWTAPRARGGTGGVIPARHHGKLFRLAWAQGVAIAAADLLPAPPGHRG